MSDEIDQPLAQARPSAFLRAVSPPRVADRVRRPESLAVIFNFTSVDAEQSVSEQHREIRRLFREGERRPWSDWNLDAVAEWLALRGSNA